MRKWIIFLIGYACLLAVCGCAPQETYTASSEHLDVRIDNTWKIDLDNEIVVAVKHVNEPLILSLEVVPVFAEDPGLQTYAMVEGDPVIDEWGRITGFQVVYRVDKDMQVQTVFPAAHFEPYPDTDLFKVSGWLVRVILTPQVIVYPVIRGKEIGEKLVVTPGDVTEHATLIEGTLPDELPKELKNYELLIIPDAHDGVSSLIQKTDIVDGVYLKGDSEFNFVEVTPEP